MVWGRGGTLLFAEDKSGKLLQLMEECVDGEYQTSSARAARTSASISSATYPGPKAKWSPTVSDDDIWALNRGGHDPHKVYAAYRRRVEAQGQPT